MAKLLFITQKIDKNDDVLGVYHRWAEELAKKTNKLNIICLYKGESTLDKSINVFSLGKDERNLEIRNWKLEIIWKLKYVYRFYKYIFSIRKEYDTVLVHMNPIYLVLGGVFWKLMNKKIFLWYNHPMGNMLAMVGIFFSNKVFCTSPYSFSAKYKKTSLMPVGVDTNFFRPMPEISKNNRQVLYLGRISPIKKIEYLIEAAKILDNRSFDFKVLIVGSPSSSIVDKEYELKLKKMSADLLSRGKIEFRPAISNQKTPEVYNSSGVFVNLTPTGSFDKTILEAMACGLLVLVSNKTVEAIIPIAYKNRVIFKEENVGDLAEKIIAYTKITNNEQENITVFMRRLVVEKHSLVQLINKLAVFIEN